ncbi:MAG: tyrosine-type recombinase/integrase [Nannocystaceae bacterium]
MPLSSEGSPGTSAQLHQILELLTRQNSKQKRSPTLGCYMADNVIPTWSELSANTQEAYHSSWKLWVAPRWAQVPLHEITGEGIDRWFRTLHAKRRSANQARKLLLRSLRLACNDGLIEKVPVPKLKAYPTTKREGLSERDLARLTEHLQELLRTKPSSHLWAVITMLNTGERRTACVSLKVSEVDFERRTITKRRKGGKLEALPITDYAATFLELIRPVKSRYFFPSKTSRTGHIHGTCLLQWFQRECAVIGITTTKGRAPVIHALRHTWASTLARSGVPVTHIQQLLGHSSMQTTMRYIHGDKDAARAAASVVTATRVALPKSKLVKP